MTTTEKVVCSVCSAQREQLNPRKSRLLKTVTLYLCNECLKANKEPRYLIILVGRSAGPMKVIEYIKHHRYDGEPILAKELLAARAQG
jgi:hypothetical protein